MVPYVIRGFDELLVEFRAIPSDSTVRYMINSAPAPQISVIDARLLADGAGDVIPRSLAEKLLVPLLVKLMQPRARRRHLAQYTASGME